MPRGRALLAASAVTPAPQDGADAASGSVFRSSEPRASSNACVTGAVTTPLASTPTDGAAHSLEVPEGQVVASSGHRINGECRLMHGDATADEHLLAAERVAVRHADHLDPTAAQAAEPTNACTGMQHKDRLIAMFLTAEEGPVASGIDPVADQASLEYVMAMDVAVRDFWTANADEIKRRCASTCCAACLTRTTALARRWRSGMA